MAQERWSQTQGDQSKRRPQALPDHERTSSLPQRKNQVACPCIVLPVHPGDRHKVRELPKEKYAIKHPCPQAQPPRCSDSAFAVANGGNSLKRADLAG